MPIVWLCVGKEPAVTSVHPVVSDDLRVIMCLAFDRRAPAEEVAAFKIALIECEQVATCCEVSGTFDFMLEAAMPDLASYNQKLEAIRGRLARLVSRYEANFVCKRFVRVPDKSTDGEIWVPCHEGHRRLDCSVIDKVTAEGDYVRVHVGPESWLVHMTMRDLLTKLGDRDFVHVHRSTIVRCAFIDRLLHRGRRWSARLSDGSSERIAKSHVARVIAKLRPSPATPWVTSTNNGQMGMGLVPSERTVHAKLFDT